MSDNIKLVFDLLKIILDILIVGAIFYLILRLIRRNARMMLLFKGLIVILILEILVKVFNLATLGYILDFMLAQGFIILAIIFQPEIRTALEQLGRNKLFFGQHKTLSLGERDKVIKVIKDAVDNLSAKQIGAIITLEQNEGLYEFISRGHHLFSDLSSEMLQSIFITQSPLHDGAVIIQGNKISCAKAYYPITQSPLISETFGTRHRAAIGISEISDCVTIVVSEELGTISITHLGIIFYDLTLNEMEEKLRELYLEGEVTNEYVERDEDEFTHIYDDNYKESEFEDVKDLNEITFDNASQLKNDEDIVEEQVNVEELVEDEVQTNKESDEAAQFKKELLRVDGDVKLEDSINFDDLLKKVKSGGDINEK